MKKHIEFKIGEHNFIIQINKWAKQSDGSALVTYKDNKILTTANMREEVKEDQDFFPLMVDFRESTYSAGLIPGGFFKREGKPSEREVLLSRLIDRPIRPLFSPHFSNETQIISMLLSADFSIDYDSMAIISASAALLASRIPFTKPIGAIKIGYSNEKFIINPGRNQHHELDMLIQAVGTKDHIVMLEAEGNEFTEELFKEGLKLAIGHIQEICLAQMELINPDKIEIIENEKLNEIYQELNKKHSNEIKDAIFYINRDERHKKLNLIKDKILSAVSDEELLPKHHKAIHQIESEQFRKTLLTEKKRTDGRDFDTIRPIDIELGVLSRAHGSAVFTRGETQSLCTITLGSVEDAKRLDEFSAVKEEYQRFMLHYNFPPFSVGEVKFLRGTSRREIGHGCLAEKALKPIIPATDKFPYTIRVVSEILESNGSSSMATVCGGTLSLMDAGVPIKSPVSGIAMGLVKEGEDYQILTDIAGYEDHFGDMDLKIAGTEKGITALQLDIKIGGLSNEIIDQTLEKAKTARLFILDKIKEKIAQPAANLSKYAPVITDIKIDENKVKDLIGPGGKTIKKFIADYNAKININDDGTVNITTKDSETSKALKKKILEITQDLEVGKVYHGKITRTENYGVFVELLPNKVGLLHISDLKGSTKKAEDYKIGESLEVRVASIDKMKGRIKLKLKDDTSRDDRSNREDRGNRNDRGRGDNRELKRFNRRY